MQTPPPDLFSPGLPLVRREMFQRAGAGLGSLALTALFNQEAQAKPTQEGIQQIAPRAKNVIFLHMVGAPSHLDLFENKPRLKELTGELVPDHLWEGLRLAFIREQPKLLGSKYKFQKHGNSGIELSELMPHLASVADELCVIKSLHTEHFNHAPAQLFFQTGFPRFGRPSLGSWVNYGIGSENEDLPGFVVLITGNVAGAGNSLWGSGFLPSRFQGIEFRTKGDPVLFLSNPEGVTPVDRKRMIDTINHLNQIQLADVGDPEIATRIAQYELAFRMQSAVPDLMEIDGESKETHEAYGTEPGKTSFANNCLLARRLVERGVRFVQLYDQGWDHHNNVFKNVEKKAKQVDQPIAALIADLKQRGLLDETLVVWGAEFGRTPMLQGNAEKGVPENAGRDHHKDAYTVWMAGGGVKRGFTYGKTDEIGFHVVENPMHVNDFHATLLHLLGVDHEALTFKFQGREFRLTDVAGKVAHDIIA
ncbi:hypothetical protein KOR42_01260 [Thalassoglobus neptunius]|uniref:Sulfatase n=1 Tax=Thalassoglobus neptunius TaxID=1938619 RepID=A0A5C5X3A6_9PLAN|nr:DUF1501 domain-containing protein [Thalassoglobus neptunius]TWT56771.1 hypothetical protein KOR42_01260 [Thalassoglobus neptunius]